MNKLQTGALFLLLLSVGFDAKPTLDVTEKLEVIENDICKINNTGNATCAMCHVLVNIVDAEIKYGNHTIVEITKIIEKICGIIKGPSGITCELVVKDIQEIVEWVSKGMSNNMICYKLHLCNSTNTITTQPHIVL